MNIPNGVQIVTHVGPKGLDETDIVLTNLASYTPSGSPLSATGHPRWAKLDFSKTKFGSPESDVRHDVLGMNSQELTECQIKALIDNQIGTLKIVGVPGLSLRMLVGDMTFEEGEGILWESSDLAAILSHIKGLISQTRH